MTAQEGKDKVATVPLSVRFSAEELELLRQQAERAGAAVSTYVRRTALGRAAPTFQLTIVPSNAPSSVSLEQAPSTGVQGTGYSGGYSTKIG